MQHKYDKEIKYNERFLRSIDTEHYERKEYAPDSYASYIWHLERHLLRRILGEVRREIPEFSLLDFACGSGRILAVAEEYSGNSSGIDISSAMVEVARGKCKRSSFVVGDFTADETLAPEIYDVITMFRFILNADTGLRQRALQWIRTRIRVPSGRLILNMHGNVNSMRHPAIVYRRWRSQHSAGENKENREMLNEMSVNDVHRLLCNSGFEVVEYHGIGLMPPTLYRVPVLRHVSRWVDRLAVGVRGFRNYSVSVLFVCRPVSEKGDEFIKRKVGESMPTPRREEV